MYLPAMVAVENGALPALVAVVEHGDVAPTPSSVGILGSTRRRTASRGRGYSSPEGRRRRKVWAQTDPSAAHAATSPPPQRARTLAEVARRFPRTVPAQLRRGNSDAGRRRPGSSTSARARADVRRRRSSARVHRPEVSRARALLASAFRGPRRSARDS